MNAPNAPLFLVYGYSGAGKSTTFTNVGQALGRGFTVYDMDLIVVNEQYQEACNNWLLIAYINYLCGNHTILFGSVPYGYNLELSEHILLFNPIHKLLLHCNESTRIERLTARGGWSEELIHKGLAASRDLYTSALDSNIPIIDTTNTPVQDVAHQIKEWVLSKV
ncbi:hypothetical protein ACFFSY_23440 [Paenibacillus aurantiacus]|uniref:AAA family ATPase n=1 Tax=Paenibacillus aurantiacus TaxID=1936118 RepID=A0ABV5KUI2_9BACL